MKKKYIYFFGNGSADGNANMKDLLGGKGANLAEMANLGFPVPSGFTITTEACDAYNKKNKTYPPGLQSEIDKNLLRLEREMGAKLGNAKEPLVSFSKKRRRCFNAGYDGYRAEFRVEP